MRNSRIWTLAIVGIFLGSPSMTLAAGQDSVSGEDVLAANIDPAVRPADDFFTYANGGWLKRNPIPPSESSWGIGNVVQDEIYARLRAINDAAATSAAQQGTDLQKVGDFWAVAMDASVADKAGLAPLGAELARISAIRGRVGFLDAVFAQLPLQTGVLFSFFVAQDEKDSDAMAVQIHQGGLGLPDRDFYFNTDDNSVRVRAEYLKHLSRILALSSATEPGAAGGVMRFETALARASRKLQDLRDPEKNYNKMALGEVTKKLTPSIDWQARLGPLGLGAATTVIVGQPEFLSELEGLLKATSLDDLRNYLRVRLISTYAPYLSSDIEQANFAFYGKVLNGQPEDRPRWKRALDAEEEALGMVLGKLFVRDYFSEAEKQRYSDMVEAIRDAYRDRIKRLSWMTDQTKQSALEKLAKVDKKVGYPDRWKDYSALDIKRSSWADNMLSAARWRFADRARKVGKPVDRTEWDMTPQTYNAYYNPSNNEIVLPAAIFTIPGVKDPQVDDAMAYGYAAASTIGHEITHGFDDEGRKFDARGNLRDWWTPEDEKQFSDRAEALVRQFAAIEPLPGMHINGNACLGENIADLGGVLLGLDAFKKTAQYQSGVPVAGLSPIQRYFLGYALGWLTQQRSERLARGLLSDVHAPAKWRVNGPLANVPAFYEAFGVRPGDGMWRADVDRANVW